MHRDARAALEVARARTSRAARALRRANRALAQAADELDPIDFRRVRTTQDIDDLADLLTGVISRGEADVLVLVPHSHDNPAPSGAQTQE